MMIGQYTEQGAQVLLRAYSDGLVHNSKELLNSDAFEELLPPNRRTSLALFEESARTEAGGLSDQSPRTVIVVGGMAVGKSSLIRSLDQAKYFRPGGYSAYLPEYAVFENVGKGVAAGLHRERGHTLDMHAPEFIREERIDLKRAAITAASAAGCSVALECHPVVQEVTLLTRQAQDAGMETTIIGLISGDGWNALEKARDRAAQTGRSYHPDVVERTHSDMYANWPSMTTLASRAILLSTREAFSC